MQVVDFACESFLSTIWQCAGGCQMYSLNAIIQHLHLNQRFYLQDFIAVLERVWQAGRMWPNLLLQN